MLNEPIYIPEHQAALSVVGETKKEITRTIKDQRGQSKEYWAWGDGNDRPQEIIEAIEKNLLLPRVIEFKRDILMSGGLVYGRVITEKGRELLEPIQENEIDDWLAESGAESYIEEATEDLFTFGNIFPELNLNMRREIAQIQELDASECRLEKQKLDGRNKAAIQNVYVSANWDQATQNDLAIVDAIDPFINPGAQIKNGRKYKYVLPIRTLSRGKKYYQRSPVESLMDSGWLDVANSIPKWKKAVMDNQLTIKWHIQINEAWLRWKYSDWDSVDDEERTKRKKDLAEKFMKVMKGSDQAGGAHLSTFKQENGQEIIGWKIEPIKHDKFGDKTYIEDATASDAHIMYSQGVDPALMGIVASSGMSAGSGSDKRMALNQLILMMRPAQRKILMPLNLKSKLDGWAQKYAKDGRFAFQFMNFHIATLDQVNSQNNNPTE